MKRTLGLLAAIAVAVSSICFAGGRRDVPYTPRRVGVFTEAASGAEITPGTWDDPFRSTSWWLDGNDYIQFGNDGTVRVRGVGRPLRYRVAEVGSYIPPDEYAYRWNSNGAGVVAIMEDGRTLVAQANSPAFDSGFFTGGFNAEPEMDYTILVSGRLN